MKITLYCRGSLREPTLDRGAIHDSSWSMARIFAVVFLILGSPLSVAEELITLEGHSKRVYSVAFSPDGERLATASSDKTVRVWNAASGQETLNLQGHAHFVTCVAYSPDGKRLASGSSDKLVKVWDVSTRAN